MSKQKNPNGSGCYTKLKDGTVRWRQMRDGQVRELTAKTLKELQQKVDKIAGTAIRKDKIKVSQWFSFWLDVYVKPFSSAQTYDQYESLTRIHILPVIGERKITSIESIDLKGIIAKMNEKGLSSWTMKHTRKVLNLAFDQAVKDNKIDCSPVVDIKIPQKQAKIRKTFTPEELQKLMLQLKDSRWYWSLKFLLVTGLRRGEFLALKWSDIDFENRRIIVERSNSKSGLGDTKSRKVHYVPLSNAAIFALDKQKEILESEMNPILFNPELKKSDLIFPAQNGTMMRGDSYYNVISRAAKKANIQAYPHMFRHTFVYASKDVLSLSELQEALGHDESTTTLDIYGEMLGDTRATANKIDSAFNSLENEIKQIEQNKKSKILHFQKAK